MAHDNLLEVQGLTKRFVQGHWPRRSSRTVLDDVSFCIRRGEIFGLVGESGCGKSTTTRCITRIIEPSGGEVRLAGVSVLGAGRVQLKALRRDMQMVFQDPYSSLDPRMRVKDIIAEGMRAHGLHQGDRQTFEKVAELMERVGLRRDQLDLLPHNFSGGERQRIGIARALAVQPKLLICDEPVASLDVSIQAQILNLFAQLRAELGLTILYIAHDLATVRHLCDRVGVMNQGRLVEVGGRHEIYADPRMQYTRELLGAVRVPDPIRQRERDRARRGAMT